MRYPNSLMTTYFNGCAGGQSEPCVVIFRDEEVVIEYTRKGQPSTYRGHLKDGIYSLRYWPEADGFVGEATLCAPEGNLMDGGWCEQEGGSKDVGTWEIELRR